MTTLPLPIETRDGIAIVRLEQPGKPVIVLDHPLIQRLEATLKSLAATARAMVLASASERVFVAGADLNAIQNASDADLADYLAYAARVFGMIPNLPIPSVAAINGAALGGGLELAMHCDGVVAAPPAMRDGQPGKPYPVGLPEAGLGLCPGWGGTNLLPARVDPAAAIARTCTGQTMMFDEAVELGLFDAVAPSSEALITTAIAWVTTHAPVGIDRRFDGKTRPPAKWIGKLDRKAAMLAALDEAKRPGATSESAAAVLEAIDAGLLRGWEAALDVERRLLVKIRHSATARTKLAEFFAKSAGTKK